MKLPSESIPRGFVRRTTSCVLLIFLVTMTVFLWAAYRSERSLHYTATFEHLEETSAVILLLPELRDKPAAVDLLALEKQLAERTSTPHRVLVTESDFSIAVSSERSLVGEDVRRRLSLESYDPPKSERATGYDNSGRWLVTSVPLDDQGRRLFVMRARGGSEGFVKRFWGVHGLHVGVTVLLFLLLLRLIGERYVRRPIEQLAGHVRRVEGGEFRTQPETYGNDEFGWLAERFSRMGLRLRKTVERLVRTEKYAAASAVAYVVATEAAEPLNSLKRHIAYLEGLAEDDRDLKRLAVLLEGDRQQLVSAVVRLEKLGPGPEDQEGSSEIEPADNRESTDS